MYLLPCHFQMKMKWNFLHPVSYQQWSNMHYGHTAHVDVYQMSFFQYNDTLDSDRIYCDGGEEQYYWYTEYCKKKGMFPNLTDTKQQNMQVLQPRLDSSKQCIILLATNLAEPQWIAIVCLLFLLDHVVYVANDTREMNQSNILLTAIHAEKENS